MWVPCRYKGTGVSQSQAHDPAVGSICNPKSVPTVVHTLRWLARSPWKCRSVLGTTPRCRPLDQSVTDNDTTKESLIPRYHERSVGDISGIEVSVIKVNSHPVKPHGPELDYVNRARRLLHHCSTPGRRFLHTLGAIRRVFESYNPQRTCAQNCCLLVRRIHVCTI